MNMGQQISRHTEPDRFSLECAADRDRAHPRRRCPKVNAARRAPLRRLIEEAPLQKGAQIAGGGDQHRSTLSRLEDRDRGPGRRPAQNVSDVVPGNLKAHVEGRRHIAPWRGGGRL